MALQAQHLAAADDRDASVSAAARAGDEARDRLITAGSAAERAGLELARDFYRCAAQLTFRANAEVVKAGQG